MTLEEAYAMVEADLKRHNITHITMTQISVTPRSGFRYELTGEAEVKRFDFDNINNGGWTYGNGETLFAAIQELVVKMMNGDKT